VLVVLCWWWDDPAAYAAGLETGLTGHNCQVHVGRPAVRSVSVCACVCTCVCVLRSGRCPAVLLAV